ncbi:(Fe-S)-binding protein [Clostridium cylindrosporum]|uniref:Fe-S oxidoreductase n=1 Tax=Clostridium cylindrosporum DSM 605 TaxID=1121307 RepID=A0A0J8DA36_CLOCY|nr:(Fe-S)-binding protein [Clostridium cylindrosporum]KMT21179.1 Fe-S oxidoreductase [Clostridium cylindrosporum DSM 605]
MKKVNLSKNIIDEVSINEEKCIGCNLCMKECPMSQEIQISPKDIMKSVKDNNNIDISIPFSCTFCSSCTSKCPRDIDLSSMYNKIRKDVFKKDKKSVNNFGYATVRFHQKSSYSSIFTGSNIPNGCTSVFFPGCSLSGYSKEIVDNTFKYLSSKIDNLGLLLTCCGKPSLDIGDEKSFESNFQSIIDILEKNGIEEVIVACSNCFNTIRDYGNVKVVSLWETFRNIGVPDRVHGIYKNSNIDVALHDPCPIRKENEIHESVRFILDEIGLKYKEFNKSKENTQCCGAGGMMMSTNRNVALKQMKLRAESTEASHIISYCESCVQSMITGGKKSLHILDFLFNDDVINSNIDTQGPRGVLSHWRERRKVATYARKSRNI